MEMPSEAEVRAVVRRVLLRTLGMSAPAPVDAHPTQVSGRPARPAVTEAAVNLTPAGSTFEIPAGALVTPLAREAAAVRGIQLQWPAAGGQSSAPFQSTTDHRPPTIGVQRTVALGADHGGYRLKETLKGFLEELGYTVMDCGTNSLEAVDYPEFAYAVARLVADRRAWRGIVVDGAGIGSCIAANKVPGVRAALCYDQATAVNSRAHNDANVLTLGAGLIGENLARQIVKTWLETEFGGGRHARRVAKIEEIENRFLVKRHDV